MMADKMQQNSVLFLDRPRREIAANRRLYPGNSPDMGDRKPVSRAICDVSVAVR
jgi:hypothetical protein